MKIVLFGASGMIGSRLLAEALRRGHNVTAVARDPKKITAPSGKISAVAGDATDADSVAALVKGHDVVISAINGTPDAVKQAAHSLIDGVAKAGVKRLLVVGGAGSLEVAPGVSLVSTPEFPAEWKDIALAHADVLQIFRKNQSLDWTYLSPAAFISPGERTGKFRLGGDQLVTDAKGESRISAEDYAVALLDEIEQPKHIRRRFTLAY